MSGDVSCAFDTFGNKVTIGWSATKEAARAAHDAIPFLTGGGEATLVSVSRSDRPDDTLAASSKQLAAGLDRHGIKTTYQRYPLQSISIGDILLNHASESGADMIATGGFGHSRIYDFVIGATTSHLLEHMTVPVLLSR